MASEHRIYFQVGIDKDKILNTVCSLQCVWMVSCRHFACAVSPQNTAPLAEEQWLWFSACLYPVRSIGKTVSSVRGKEAIFCELLDAVMGLNIDSSPKRRQTSRKKFLEQIFLANTCRKAVSGSCWDVVVLLVTCYLV